MKFPAKMPKVPFLLLSWLSLFSLGTTTAAASDHATASSTGAAHYNHHRFLQLDDLGVPGDLPLPTCDEDGKPTLDGVASDLFGGDGQVYDSSCTCTEASNYEETFENIQGGDSFNLTLIAQAISDLSINSEYNCKNQCPTCFLPGDDSGTSSCGRYSARVFTDIAGLSSITAEDLIAVLNGTITGIIEGNAGLEYCVEYTSGPYISDTVCWGQSIDIATDTIDVVNATEFPCFISYNGQDCNSCSSTNPTSQEECFIADCSNNGEMDPVNSCAGTGVSGQFQPLAYYGGGSRINFTTELTPDPSCDKTTMAPDKTTMAPEGDSSAATAAAVVVSAWLLVMASSFLLY